MNELTRHYRIIRKPVVTEKATDASANRNAYTFRVPRGANKVEIRQAVEKLFDVKVKSVNTLHTKSKWRVRGRNIGQTQVWKKAIVSLGEGQTIDIL